jgi:site-specific recombinase XerC
MMMMGVLFIKDEVSRSRHRVSSAPTWCREHTVLAANAGRARGARPIPGRSDYAVARQGRGRGRYSPHSCRHAFALGLYERTGDVLLVQAALGHRAISSTLVYARASPERVRAAVVG